MGSAQQSQTLWSMVQSGGFAMIPLIICSLGSWFVIVERFWRFRKLGKELQSFQILALEKLLEKNTEGLRDVCRRFPDVPSSRVILVGIERLESKDARLRARWREAMERTRIVLNQELRSRLWILGTIASAAPFIGLFGTVVGILRSFKEMASTGSGGFAVVASGISESLIATAAGIVVAVIAALAFNSFQTWLGQIVLRIRIQIEETAEVLSGDSTPEVRN